MRRKPSPSRSWERSEGSTTPNATMRHLTASRELAISRLTSEMRVHGCDVCQEACPRNSAKLKAKYPEDPFLVKLAGEFSLIKMLEMPDQFYERTIHPIMHNYNKGKTYLRRNDAVALGNTGNPKQFPVLARATEDPEELVRGYSAWALGRIAGPWDKVVLESRLKQKGSNLVLSEIEQALLN
jgi:epoxyqueuosine reductase